MTGIPPDGDEVAGVDVAGNTVFAEDVDELEGPAADGEAAAVDEDDEPEPVELELSTGLLTPQQHATVAAWIERLRLDEPLPGVEPKGGMLRLIGIDDRPPASISDVIAAAVRDLCGRRMPKPLVVAQYAAAARTASRDQSPDRGQHRPVTVVLRAALAEAVEPYPTEVGAWLVETRRAAVAASVVAHPGEDDGAERRQFVELKLIGLGIHEAYAQGWPRKIPTGTLARMGLDHWRHKPVDEAIAAAISYAQEVKRQRHRMRKDAHRRA